MNMSNHVSGIEADIIACRVTIKQTEIEILITNGMQQDVVWFSYFNKNR